MPGENGFLEGIKKTLEVHWALVRDAQSWPGYRQGEGPPSTVIDQALSSIKDYLRCAPNLEPDAKLMCPKSGKSNCCSKSYGQ